MHPPSRDSRTIQLFRLWNMLFLVGLGLPAKLTSSSSLGNIIRIAFCACNSTSSIPEPFLWAIASARSAACKDEPAFCQLCKGPTLQFASNPSICGIKICASFPLKQVSSKNAYMQPGPLRSSCVSQLTIVAACVIQNILSR
jgi:hypothetical protein